MNLMTEIHNHGDDPDQEAVESLIYGIRDAINLIAGNIGRADLVQENQNG